MSTASAPVAGTPSRSTILQLFKASPELRAEVADVMSEVLRDELATIKAEISSQQQTADNQREDGAAQTLTGAQYVSDLADLYAAAAKELPGTPLSKWTHQDESGTIYGFPEPIEIDIMRRENDTFLCDIRHEVDIASVVILLRIGQMYKKLNPKGTLACIIFTRKITPQASKIAAKCKIRVVVVQP
jgi:hypothetical protein